MNKGKYILLILIFFFFLIFLTLAAFLYLEFGKPPAVKSRSYLEISLSGEIQ